LAPVLISKFNEFPKQLVATHGNDMASSESGTATPVATKYSPAPPGEVRAKAAAETKASSSSVVNTSTVTVEARLQASADDMYMFLSDEKRIPMWSRSAAKVSYQMTLLDMF
jgi:activator of HSP90 ATPase